MAARVGRSGWRTDKKNDGNDMNDARKVAPGIEPGLPESESGVITITLHNPLVGKRANYLLYLAKRNYLQNPHFDLLDSNRNSRLVL